MRIPGNRIQQIIAIGLSLSGYIWLGYYTERADFIQVLAGYSILFVLYGFLLYKNRSGNNFKIAIGGAVLLRLSLLLMTPNLSDDYFRFIWDGLLSVAGVNPYLSTPAELFNSQASVPGINRELFQNLNSSGYHSAYPPVSQFIFRLSAIVAGANIFGNVIVLRVLILLAEFGSLALLWRLAKRFKPAPAAILIYGLNPLVIMELTGNLHFEALMIFFLLVSVFFLVKEKRLLSAVFMGLAIGTKLIPLIFLPLLVKRLGISRSLRYYLITGVTVLLLFTPFLAGESIANYFSSLSLYFRVLEFNASLYYLLRWVYLATRSDLLITVIQVLLPVLTFLAVVFISARQKADNQQSLFRGMLFCLTIYLLLTNNVHPWNLTTLVMLSVFTGFRFVLVWSWGVILGYSAYRTFPYIENLWLVATEYLLVLVWISGEIITGRKSRSRGNNGE
ncbi:glycosyltransferase 87 family protein [Chloroflexota bacterium]